MILQLMQRFMCYLHSKYAQQTFGIKANSKNVLQHTTFEIFLELT